MKIDSYSLTSALHVTEEFTLGSPASDAEHAIVGWLDGIGMSEARCNV